VIKAILDTTPASGAQNATPQPRLVRAAHEFEAQMMKELLAPLAQSSGLTGNDEDGDSGSAGALGAYATESLAGAISQRGGLGIARDLIQTLSHSGTSGNPGAVTGK
jgi:hypothetical protein